MNALIKFPILRKSTVPVALKPRLPLDHLEFLPANLELLETPSSPKASFFLWLLCAMLAAALAWSYFASLDIHAIAKGRIQPSGRSKVVQPLEAGRVREIKVSNGMRVAAGDTLVELDPTETVADRDALSGQIEWLTAEIVRRSVAVDAMRHQELDPQVTFPPTVSETVSLREKNALKADLSQYFATKESLLAQRAQQEATKLRLAMSIESRQALLVSLRERVDMKEKLIGLNSGSRSQVLDALQVMQNEETNLASDKGQLLEADAGVRSADRKVEQLTQEFVAKHTQELADSQRKLSDARQALIKADAKASRTRLTAPIDGVVQQSLVTTIGQVVGSGQPLMVIVPIDQPLEVEALIENQDIAFVKVGQDAIIKVDAFPFTRYGTLTGTVRRVSSDAVDQRDAGATSDASTAQRGGNSGTVSGVSQVQNLVYPVTIELSTAAMPVDGRNVPLGPGMQVTAEIKTGNRRVIDYVLAPLREISSQAARER
jgi:hemolysin D